jgi:hypothetical protein
MKLDAETASEWEIFTVASDYHARDGFELSVTRGQKIVVLDRNTEARGLWLCQIGNRSGLVPALFVH